MAKQMTPVEILTSDEGRAVLEQFSRRAPTGVRNRAIVGVMWHAGLRSAEVRALLLRDVDLDAGVVHVRHGKGNRPRKVGINPTLTLMLTVWVERRKTLRRVSSQLLFCTLDGAPLSGQYLRRSLQRAGQRAGVERRVHPHVFRHMFAVGLARRGVPLVTIQQAMGHATIVITAVYLSHLYPEGVIEATKGED